MDSVAATEAAVDHREAAVDRGSVTAVVTDSAEVPDRAEGP